MNINPSNLSVQSESYDCEMNAQGLTVDRFGGLSCRRCCRGRQPEYGAAPIRRHGGWWLVVGARLESADVVAVSKPTSPHALQLEVPKVPKVVVVVVVLFGVLPMIC